MPGSGSRQPRALLAASRLGSHRSAVPGLGLVTQWHLQLLPPPPAVEEDCLDPRRPAVPVRSRLPPPPVQPAVQVQDSSVRAALPSLESPARASGRALYSAVTQPHRLLLDSASDSSQVGFLESRLQFCLSQMNLRDPEMIQLNIFKPHLIDLGLGLKGTAHPKINIAILTLMPLNIERF